MTNLDSSRQKRTNWWEDESLFIGALVKSQAGDWVRVYAREVDGQWEYACVLWRGKDSSVVKTFCHGKIEHDLT